MKDELKNKKELNFKFTGITFENFAKMHIEHEKLYREENTLEVKEYTLKKFIVKLMDNSVEQTLKTYSHVNDSMMNRATQTIRSIF